MVQRKRCRCTQLASTSLDRQQSASVAAYSSLALSKNAPNCVRMSGWVVSSSTGTNGCLYATLGRALNRYTWWRRHAAVSAAQLTRLRLRWICRMFSVACRVVSREVDDMNMGGASRGAGVGEGGSWSLEPRHHIAPKKILGYIVFINFV